ncbi:hypothetical protein JTB14_017947 [Gonioctena quinquepunctata]|nr:hypothetical protein JTB14_017947 [Gonioctena quinquepunctata]
MVLLWPNIQDHLIKEFTLKSKHTNTVVISEPYRDDYNGWNTKMYENNLHFMKELFSNKLDQSHFFDGNSFLRKSNFNPHGHLNNSGRWHLAKALLKLIEKMDKKGKQQKNLNTIVSKEIEKEVLKQNEDNKPLAPDMKKMGNFSYPRLDRAAPKD